MYARGRCYRNALQQYSSWKSPNDLVASFGAVDDHLADTPLDDRRDRDRCCGNSEIGAAPVFARLAGMNASDGRGG